MKNLCFIITMIIIIGCSKGDDSSDSNSTELLKFSKKSLILACSALKETYRLKIVKGLKYKTHWFFLKGGFRLINKRLENRKNHFMSNNLLKSQFEILEIPDYGIEIDISKKKEDILNNILTYI